MSEPRRLLAVLAHPDDESFGIGGTLARYAAEGVETHVCIVTDGAAGHTEAHHLEGYTNLAERRAQELLGATRELGATLHTLPYRDSGMEGSDDNQHPEALIRAPLDEVACHLVALIRKVRPQVIITHDPTGGYFHPDHIFVSRAMERAWVWASDATACPEALLPPWAPSRLYWTVIPQRWIKRMIWLLRLFRKDPKRFGSQNDIDLTRLGTPDDEIHVQLDVGRYLAKKEAAGRHHASQGGGRIGPPIPAFLNRRLFGSELYSQAQPGGPTVHDDLFAGIP